MTKGIKAWKENKLETSETNIVMPLHDSISLFELQRFVALGLCDKGTFHKSNLNLHEPPFIRTKP